MLRVSVRLHPEAERAGAERNLMAHDGIAEREGNGHAPRPDGKVSGLAEPVIIDAVWIDGFFLRPVVIKPDTEGLHMIGWATAHTDEVTSEPRITVRLEMGLLLARELRRQLDALLPGH